MFITPTLSISCITCMQQQGEEGGKRDHESHGKLRLNGIVPAPYGGAGGGSWDDGIYNGVREITVFAGLCIDSIRVTYDKDGELLNAEKHGGDGGSIMSQILLNYPDEFLVSVSGTYIDLASTVGPLALYPVVIRSLKFKSNRRAFGPFGTKGGIPFAFTVADGGQIVGMKGRSGIFLDAIGVHISHPPKRNLFRRFKENLKMPSNLSSSKALDILSKITRPLSIFQCTCISL